MLASGRNVNVLVLDTEVYSNTGGQMSKSTPRGAVAKFAAGGKPVGKKDLGLIAMTYGNIYVASVAMGAKDEHTLKAFVEAESYPGPSLIIAYSHCIAHGIALDPGVGAKQQKLAVESGQWLLYRYDPRRAERGENPLQLDSAAAKTKVQDYLLSENRFKMLTKSKPEDAKKFFAQAQVGCRPPLEVLPVHGRPRLKPAAAPRQTATTRSTSNPNRRALRPSATTGRGQDQRIITHESLMDLSTTYLGLKLRTPLVPSASPLSEEIDNIKRMEDAGASAVVLYSLFEEQLAPGPRSNSHSTWSTAPTASPKRSPISPNRRNSASARRNTSSTSPRPRRR